MGDEAGLGGDIDREAEDRTDGFALALAQPGARGGERVACRQHHRVAIGIERFVLADGAGEGENAVLARRHP